MDRIKLLQSRKQELRDCGKTIRKQISELVDDSSFVESDCYSFSHSEYYEQDALGEGVVTGFATIDGYPVNIVAQNYEVLGGGLSEASCEKIVKCMRKSLYSGNPILYLLQSNGVQVGEGVGVLEGIGDILSTSSLLRDASIIQIAVTLGNVYGSLSVLPAMCDFSFVTKEGCLSYASPQVILASEKKQGDKQSVGAIKSNEYNDLFTAEIKDISSLRENILKIFNNAYSEFETEDDYNRSEASLNKKVDAKTLIKASFDKDSFIEINKEYAKEVITGIGSIGDNKVAGILFDGENGVELDVANVSKIIEFVKFANRNDYPIVTFVNTLGIKADRQTSSSLILKKISELIDCYRISQKISVITGYAVGLGYTLFASKSMNVDYTMAFATANVGLYNEKIGAVVEMDAKVQDVEEVAEKYKENMDPVNFAKKGYVDDIIEPKFIRAHLISAIQSNIKG